MNSLLITSGRTDSYLWWEVKTVDEAEAREFFNKTLKDEANSDEPAVIVGQTYTLIIQKIGKFV